MKHILLYRYLFKHRILIKRTRGMNERLGHVCWIMWAISLPFELRVTRTILHKMTLLLEALVRGSTYASSLSVLTSNRMLLTRFSGAMSGADCSKSRTNSCWVAISVTKCSFSWSLSIRKNRSEVAAEKRFSGFK